MNMNRVMLQLEGLSILTLSVILYAYNDLNWLLAILLLLVFDLSMFGYKINDRVGQIIYNIFHTYSISLMLTCLGIIFTIDLMLAIGLIWTAHIAMDRMLGLGLRCSIECKVSHFDL